MCGRFALSAKTEDIEKLINGVKIDGRLAERYNIAPTQDIAVILNTQPDSISYAHWGLIPSWAKDDSGSARMINARAETLNEKVTFKNLIKKKRCIIPATGFYEWKKEAGTKIKQPYFIKMIDSSIFGFAGLWDNWKNTDGETIISTTIITTTPNELIRDIHDRMPVILIKEDYELWLNSDVTDFSLLNKCLLSYPADEMEVFPVSRLVNTPTNDLPECSEAITI